MGCRASSRVRIPPFPPEVAQASPQNPRAVSAPGLFHWRCRPPPSKTKHAMPIPPLWTWLLIGAECSPSLECFDVFQADDARLDGFGPWDHDPGQRADFLG